MLFRKKNPVKLDGCEVYIWLFTNSLVLDLVIIICVLYGFDPLNTRYLYHFFSKESRLNWSLLLWGVVEYFGQLCFFSSWVLILILVWVYSKSTTFWLRQMR